MVTYTLDPSALASTWIGPVPTGIVAITVFVAVLITDTLLVARLATYTLDPSGVMDIPLGPVPTGIVAVTRLVVVLITDTLALFLLHT